MEPGKMTTHHVNENRCLSCGEACDAATSTGRRGPRAGDISLCFYCGHIMAFADDLSLRELTDAEIKEVAGDPKLLAFQKARGMVKK